MAKGLVARFEDHVDRSGDHHLWRGACTANGVGQVRVDGKLMTAPRIAWEITHGPLPSSARVSRCPDEPACVRVDHLSVVGAPASDVVEVERPRSARGGGSKRETSPGVWQLTVGLGVDDRGSARRTYRTMHGSEKEATRAMAAFVTEVDANEVVMPASSSKAMTVDELVDWYVGFARDDRGLDHSTLVNYRHVYGLWLKGPIGHLRASQLSAKQIDGAFGLMRRAGLSRSRMNNARALLSGAYKWGRRHGYVHRDPVAGFELPTSSHVTKPTTPPEFEELIGVLDAADLYDPGLAPILKLGAVTGMRRGELSGLRRDRVNLDRARSWSIVR